ncbi:MAG: aldo/keto reductase [Verrucomicrobiae bacterium]|nr:aldo/keto reductase [Verrucomicrobiae bacterium]
MKQHSVSRRQFIAQTAALATTTWVTSCAILQPRKRTATDLVPLGKTGVKISRLGLGTGSNGGRVQHDLGQEAFTKLVRYAYDRGICYFDCALSYRTHPWIGDALKGLPREKIFLLSKIGGTPEKPAELIDKLLLDYKTDYIDCLLVHCAVTDTWMEERRRVIDAIDGAIQKGKVRLKGVSCHALPALRIAAASPWVQVNLVRVNPQAKHIDGETPKWNVPGNDLTPVMELIRTMHNNGHGVIGMKIIGNGDFTDPEDREKSIRFAMSHPEIHAITIGCKSTAEVDEAIERINNALAG